MKNILLKFGLLSLLFTLIFSNHLNNSKYYRISNSLKKNFQQLNLPNNLYNQEDYYDLINGHPYSGLIVTYTNKEILPFQDYKQIIISILLLISSTSIVFAINLKEIQAKRLILIILPIFLWFSLNNLQTKIISAKDTSIKNKIVNINSKLSDLKNEIESQETRISDLEY